MNLITLPSFFCEHQFQFVIAPGHSIRPSRSTLPIFQDTLLKSVVPNSVQGSGLQSECKGHKQELGNLFFDNTANRTTIPRPSSPSWSLYSLRYPCSVSGIYISKSKYIAFVQYPSKRFLTEDGEVLALIVQVVEANKGPPHIQLGSNRSKH